MYGTERAVTQTDFVPPKRLCRPMFRRQLGVDVAALAQSAEIGVGRDEFLE